MAEEFLLTEDGFQLILEDGSGFLLLDDLVVIPEGGGSGRKGDINLVSRFGRVVVGQRFGRVSVGARSGRVIL